MEQMVAEMQEAAANAENNNKRQKTEDSLQNMMQNTNQYYNYDNDHNSIDSNLPVFKQE